LGQKIRSKPDASRFHCTLFRRATQEGTIVLYARLLETATGRILAQRSTGTDDERLAAAKAGQLLVELPLAKLAQLKSARDEEGFEAAERLRNMDLAVCRTESKEMPDTEDSDGTRSLSDL
jgi:hypothetical protein